MKHVVRTVQVALLTLLVSAVLATSCTDATASGKAIVDRYFPGIAR